MEERNTSRRPRREKAEEQPRNESLVYGKVFADLRATIKGPLDGLNMRGNLNLLGNTDVSYVLTDSPLTVQDRLGSLETFMRMVESGNGVTFIPELATYQLSEQQKELVRPFAIPKPAREIVWVTRKDFIRHSVAGILIESIRKSVPKEMRTLQAGLRVV